MRKCGGWVPMLGLVLAMSSGAQIPPVEGAAKTGAALRYIDVAAGGGDPAMAGQRYTVHYTGWLRDGTKFDSSRDQDEPFQFVQGRRHVIAGWDIGFEGMKVGGRRRLFVPPQLAYGAAGSGAIPPDAELIFDVELLKVEEVPKNLPALDLLTALDGLEKKFVALAEAMPEEKLGWRPGEGSRSFAEVLVHVTDDNRLMREMAEGKVTSEEIERRAAASAKREKSGVKKAELVAGLRESFEEIRKTLEPMRVGALAREDQFFGALNSVRGVFVLLETHAAEHLGQLIASSRMNGIAPPWSQ